jgi:hypothetical protein
MIVASKSPTSARQHPQNKPMNTHHTTLEQLARTLQACELGELTPGQLATQWRSEAKQLALPETFGRVLGDLLDRIESSALFSEESCSFSAKDQLQGLQIWLEKARLKLS